MAKDRAGKPPFRGFRSPTYTQVPDELFDELLPELSGAELKVLLYIIRRTFGFKRERDSISLSQMLNGIQGRDGQTLDRGAGVSKPTLLQALRSLEARGIIATERRRSAEKGDEPTVYTLRFAADEGGDKKFIHPLVNKLDHPPGQVTSPPAWSRNLTTQQTERQETDFELSNFERPPDRFAGTGDPPSDTTATSAESLVTDAASADTTAPGYAALRDLVTHRRRQPNSATPRRKGRPPGTPEERDALAAYLADFARELGDAAPLSSTITRVLTLFQTAQLPPEQWGDVLYQARRITQERTAQIRTLAADGEQGMRRKNKMPYFLAVLADLLGVGEGRALPATAPTPALAETTYRREY